MDVIFGKLLFGVLLVILLCQCQSRENITVNENKNTASVATTEAVLDIQNTHDSTFPSINVSTNQILESPFKIRVNSEGKWYGFEGELGTIELFDKNKNSISLCILSTTENWMVKGPVNYYCDLKYNVESSGNGRLVIKNNNPSGHAEYDKSFAIPVRYVAN